MAAYLSQSASLITDLSSIVQRRLAGRDLGNEFIAQRKYDGVSCIIKTGAGEALSRVGTAFKSVDHIIAECQRKFGTGVVIFGELWHESWNQSSISGAARRISEQAPELQFMVFDAVSIASYDKGEEHVFYTKRLEYVTKCLATRSIGDKVVPVASYNPGTYGSPQAFMGLVMERRGFDGIVLKDPYAFWLPGKDKQGASLKVKPILTFDLEVIGIEEGKGRNKGRVGAMLCRFKDGKIVKVSGMDDECRVAWWANPSWIVGKIIEVEAMALSSNGSLREPRFKGIRYDKDKADY